MSKTRLRQIEELSPDSITVHSLAVKRASRLAQMPELKEAALQEERGRQMEAMIDLAAESAARMGMKPYYLYRQENMPEILKNVGYAKVDKAGIYNILIMEENSLSSHWEQAVLPSWSLTTDRELSVWRM